MLRRLYCIIVITGLAVALGATGRAQEGRPPAYRTETPAPKEAPAKPNRAEAKAKRVRASTPRPSQTAEAFPDFVVRVNIIKPYPRLLLQPGAPAPTVLNGAVMGNFAPGIQEVYATTGLVLDEKGHILTYVGERWIEFHLPHKQIEIVTLNGDVVNGELQGIDERQGFAIVNGAGLKVKPAPIEARRNIAVGTAIKKIELLRPALVRVRRGQVERWDAQGQMVIALDKPEGRAHRSVLTGGPVLANDGKVVGLAMDQRPTASSAPRVSATVLPMADIWPSAEQIIKTHQSISGGWLGVYIDNLIPALRWPINAKAEHGILVTGIDKGSPAEKAGIRIGDIIQTFNQKSVTDGRDFVRQVQATPPGQAVTLRLVRGDVTQDIRVRVAKRGPENYAVSPLPPVLEINTPEVMAEFLKLKQRYQHDAEDLKRQARSSRTWEEDMRKLDREFEEQQRALLEAHMRLVRGPSNFPTMGVFCHELPAQLSAFLGVASGKGILVSHVMPSTPAEVAGLKTGDVMLKIDQTELSHCAELVREVQKRRAGDKVKVTIWRHKKPLEFSLTLDKK